MDAEMLVVKYLNQQNLGATAYYDIPSTRPSTFIVVERTGGADSQLVIESPLIDIQCWASRRPDAANLAFVVKQALQQMEYDLPNVFHASITSTYRDTDLETGTPRFHVITELTLNN